MSQQLNWAPKRHQLNKGKACLNCRRRKVKCDAKKPICSPCERFTGGGCVDCEYSDSGMAQSQILEEQITIVQSRIRELEQPHAINHSVVLQNPFGPDYVQHMFEGPTDFFAAAGPATSTSRIPYELLVKTSLAHAKALGFFLHTGLFDPMSAGAPPEQLINPALLNAISLWGCVLLSHADPALESTLLAAALHATSTGLASAHRPGAILQTLQASLLLAQYFFHGARLLEARYHAIAALSIVLGADFHKIRSGPGSRRGGHGSPSEIAPAVTLLEEGERINAFWAVLTLNCCLFAVADPMSGSSVDYGMVDVPWPLDIELYERDSQFLPLQSSRTIESFLANRVDQGHSVLALRAKAAVLFEQASLLSSQATDHAQLSAKHIALNAAIEMFKQTLGANQHPGLLIAHVLSHASTLLLHRPFVGSYDESRQSMLRAARMIVDITRSQNWTALGYIDPVFGTVWGLALDFLGGEISRLKHRGSPGSAQMLRQFNEAGQNVLSAMTAAASRCKMIDVQIESTMNQFLAMTIAVV